MKINRACIHVHANTGSTIINDKFVVSHRGERVNGTITELPTVTLGEVHLS